jgi:dynactin 1
VRSISHGLFLTFMKKIEEMRVVIEDLEALKDLNDELEENHVETEKALQEDIGEGLNA